LPLLLPGPGVPSVCLKLYRDLNPQHKAPWHALKTHAKRSTYNFWWGRATRAEFRDRLRICNGMHGTTCTALHARHYRQPMPRPRPLLPFPLPRNKSKLAKSGGRGDEERVRRRGEGEETRRGLWV